MTRDAPTLQFPSGKVQIMHNVRQINNKPENPFQNYDVAPTFFDKTAKNEKTRN